MKRALSIVLSLLAIGSASTVLAIATRQPGMDVSTVVAADIRGGDCTGYGCYLCTTKPSCICCWPCAVTAYTCGGCQPNDVADPITACLEPMNNKMCLQPPPTLYNNIPACHE
jgi:hypothetical protein